MKLAVLSPVVTFHPATHGEWERDATIDDLAAVAVTADRLGYDHLTCSEHVGIPAAEVGRRGARYWDPLPTFGYVAARTTRIRLATHVLVLGYHHPLAIAKRYGTLDVVSGGRLVLGVGVGSLREEFDLLGAPFDDRGPRADEALRALRAAMSEPEPSFRGEHLRFEDLVIDPTAVQDRVPIWVGGRTLRSLRRAVALADGWNPFAVTGEQVRTWLDRVEPPADFDVVLPTVATLDPLGDPDPTREALAATAGCGATIAYPRFAHHSLAHYLECLEALAELHDPTGSVPGPRPSPGTVPGQG